MPDQLTFQTHTQFSRESVGSGGDGARSLPALAARPRWCRVSRHTPAPAGGVGAAEEAALTLGVSPSLQSRDKEPAEARRGSPPAARCLCQ